MRRRQDCKMASGKPKVLDKRTARTTKKAFKSEEQRGTILRTWKSRESSRHSVHLSCSLVSVCTPSHVSLDLVAFWFTFSCAPCRSSTWHELAKTKKEKKNAPETASSKKKKKVWNQQNQTEETGARHRTATSDPS